MKNHQKNKRDLQFQIFFLIITVLSLHLYNILTVICDTCFSQYRIVAFKLLFLFPQNILLKVKFHVTFVVLGIILFSIVVLVNVFNASYYILYYIALYYIIFCLISKKRSHQFSLMTSFFIASCAMGSNIKKLRASPNFCKFLP